MAVKNFTMKSNNGAGWDTLYPKTNMAQVEGLEPKLGEVESVAKGASKAKVFDTVAALDSWLAVAANKASLQIGDNLYVREKSAPDYWWDGESRQELETEKVNIELASTSNDGLMQKGDKSKLDGIAAGATKVTVPSDIGAATAAQGTKADSAYQKPAGGIAKTDLDSAVQSSLSKADSALQSVSEASATVKGVSLLGATNGAARFGQKADVGLSNVPNTDATNASNITSGTLSADRLGVPVITLGTATPSNPKTGDIWYDENNN